MNEELLASWRERVQAGTFSEGIVGVRQIRVFGRSGDEVVLFPQLRSLDLLDTLAPDEQAAARFAATLIETHRQRGRAVVATTANRRGSFPVGTIVETLDLTKEADLLILSRVVGG